MIYPSWLESNDTSVLQVDLNNIENPDYKIDLDYYVNPLEVINEDSQENTISVLNEPHICCISEKHFNPELSLGLMRLIRTPASPPLHLSLQT